MKVSNQAVTTGRNRSFLYERVDSSEKMIDNSRFILLKDLISDRSS